MSRSFKFKMIASYQAAGPTNFAADSKMATSAKEASLSATVWLLTT